MRVSLLRIRNFRCFGDTDTDSWGFRFRPGPQTNLIVGPNGAGKTSILDAIDLVLNADGRANAALISEYDFHDCIADTRMAIEVRLTELDPVLAEFESDIEWIDPADGWLAEEKGIEPNGAQHQRAIVVQFEAGIDSQTGEIEWGWFLPKFPATEVEPRKELSRSQHRALGFHRIRPAVSAGAFTLGQYSPLGRYLRKMRYRLARTPIQLRGEETLPECTLLDLDCWTCGARAGCLPSPVSGAVEDEQQTLGDLLGAMSLHARGLLGTASWEGMVPSLGSRYGDLGTTLAGTTIGMRPKSNPSQFIPFEHLSSGEKYALSFALARSQIPGDAIPVIVMEEPETALYPTGVATLIREIQAVPTGGAPQIFLSSHSESVLRCALPGDVYVIGKDHRVQNLQETLRVVGSSSKDPLSRPEYLLIPGGLNVLLADKVLVVEGAQDAIVSGYLDRIAAEIAATVKSQHVSLGAGGWTVFPAQEARTVPTVVQVLLGLGKTVAALLDSDAPGKAAAERTKDVCPTFVFKSAAGGPTALEEALLGGLDTAARDRVLVSYRSLSDCAGCDMAGPPNCWTRRHEKPCGDRDDRKRRLQTLCLEEYSSLKLFPKAFLQLIMQLDTAMPGMVRELDVDV